MGADVEPFPVQRPHLVPRHPGIPSAPLLIPERHDISADPLRDDEEGSRQRKLLEYGHRILEIVAIPVVEGDHQLAIRSTARLQLPHQLRQRYDSEAPLEKAAVALERLTAHRQPVGRIRIVVHTMKGHDKRSVPEQDRIETRGEETLTEES